MIGRLAGGIRAFDDAYSNRIARMYPDTKAGVLAASFGGGMPSTRLAEMTSGQPGTIDHVMAYALPAINAVPKYVLPAVGITMAGQGLLALTDQMNQQSNGNLYMS